MAEARDCDRAAGSPVPAAGGRGGRGCDRRHDKEAVLDPPTPLCRSPDPKAAAAIGGPCRLGDHWRPLRPDVGGEWRRQRSLTSLFDQWWVKLVKLRLGALASAAPGCRWRCCCRTSATAPASAGTATAIGPLSKPRGRGGDGQAMPWFDCVSRPRPQLSAKSCAARCDVDNATAAPPTTGPQRWTQGACF